MQGSLRSLGTLAVFRVVSLASMFGHTRSVLLGHPERQHCSRQPCSLIRPAAHRCCGPGTIPGRQAPFIEASLEIAADTEYRHVPAPGCSRSGQGAWPGMREGREQVSGRAPNSFRLHPPTDLLDIPTLRADINRRLMWSSGAVRARLLTGPRAEPGGSQRASRGTNSGPSTTAAPAAGRGPRVGAVPEAVI